MSADDMLLVVHGAFGLFTDLDELSISRARTWLDALLRPAQFRRHKSAILSIYTKQKKHDNRIIVSLDPAVVCGRNDYVKWLGEHIWDDIANKDSRKHMNRDIGGLSARIFEFDKTMFKGKCTHVRVWQYDKEWETPYDFHDWDGVEGSGIVSLEVYPEPKWCQIPRLAHKLELPLQGQPTPTAMATAHVSVAIAAESEERRQEIPRQPDASSWRPNPLPTVASRSPVAREGQIAEQPSRSEFVKSDPYEDDQRGYDKLRASPQQHGIKKEPRDNVKLEPELPRLLSVKHEDEDRKLFFKREDDERKPFIKNEDEDRKAMFTEQHSDVKPVIKDEHRDERQAKQEPRDDDWRRPAKRWQQDYDDHRHDRNAKRPRYDRDGSYQESHHDYYSSSSSTRPRSTSHRRGYGRGRYETNRHSKSRSRSRSPGYRDQTRQTTKWDSRQRAATDEWTNTERSWEAPRRNQGHSRQADRSTARSEAPSTTKPGPLSNAVRDRLRLNLERDDGQRSGGPN